MVWAILRNGSDVLEPHLFYHGNQGLFQRTGQSLGLVTLDGKEGLFAVIPSGHGVPDDDVEKIYIYMFILCDVFREEPSDLVVTSSDL